MKHKRFYRIMLGRKSKHADNCYKGEFIGAGFLHDMNLSNNLPENSREFKKAFIPEYLEKHPEVSKISAGLACGALHTVAKGIKNNDIVLCPDGSGGYFVGEVIEDYSYHPGEILPHRRKVKWFSKTIERSEMSKPLQNSTGYIGTVCDITKYAEEIEQLLVGDFELSCMESIDSDLALLFPDEEVRKLCLSVLLESIIEANTYGSNKWGVHYGADSNRLRFLVGSLIVLSIHKQGVWMALDQQLLHELKEESDMLNVFQDWQWDDGRWSEFTRIPSRNGFYMPSDEHSRIWPIIRRFHFSYINNAANMFSQLREDSQKKHMPQVLTYLRDTLKRYVPEPVYEHDVLSISNPIDDIKAYQSTQEYKNLPETERDALIKSRIGQGKFREKLINYWKGCAVTACQTLELLRASHIKPWRTSSNREKLDVYNGLLLLPNLDVSFDNGFISFSDGGQIIISDHYRFSEYEQGILGIHPDMRIAGIDKRHCEYLKYHREHVFNKRLRKD